MPESRLKGSEKMTDPMFTLAVTTALLAAVAMVTAAALTAWRGWLSLKQQELMITGQAAQPQQSSAGTRIEMADLKERIRKLEAIAAGVDL